MTLSCSWSHTLTCQGLSLTILAIELHFLSF